MADFQFLKNPIFQRWVILAPRRAKRPNSEEAKPEDKAAQPQVSICPFCPGKEGEEHELFRIPSAVIANEVKQSQDPQAEIATPPPVGGSARNDTGSDWAVRVLPNKYPFAQIHELIIHTREHDKSFAELSVEHVGLILQAYRARYNEHVKNGQVYLFHNRGVPAGESQPHAHTQLVVVPEEVSMDIPRLDPFASFGYGPKPQTLESKQQEIQIEDMVETTHFYMFCPRTSQWPDEVWVAPKKRGRRFGEITDDEISDFAAILKRLITIMTIRHNNDFPFNYYIYPSGDWYLRIIPRLKTLGGFELGTGIYVNTQDPQESMQFIKTHFSSSAEGPDAEKIRAQHPAEYHKAV